MTSVSNSRPSVLQVGYGNFGPIHLNAWRALGLADRLFVADPSDAARDAAHTAGIAPDRLAADYREHLESVDVVDIVSATNTHFEICAAALRAGCDVFIEKPMTVTLAEAEDLAKIVAETGRILQVGFYFRHRCISRAPSYRRKGFG